jgi:putative hydrolase of the HAD superfamily
LLVELKIFQANRLATHFACVNYQREARATLQNGNGKFSGQASAIRAVIFDYGEVLCQIAPLAQFAPMARILNITPERLVQRYMQNRLDYDRGDLTAEEYWTGFGRENGVALGTAQVEELDRLDCGLWWNLDPQLLDWVARLRAKGIKAGVISNMFIGLARQIRQSAPWLDRFDDYTFSAEIRATKPDPAIYLHSLSQLGVAPHEALFLDDRETNIRGAQAVGMEGLVYANPGRLREELQVWGFGILPEAAAPKEAAPSLKTS